MADFGTGVNRKLTVFISNDNGVTYPISKVFDVNPLGANYDDFTHTFDLSSLNGSNGRIKFEKTDGTASIRFRDLNIEATPDGYVYNGLTWYPSDPSGNSNSADNITIISGTASLSANTDAKNVTINSGATLEIENVLTIAGDITNNGNLIFLSTATGNGELGIVPASSTITGNATVQRYMSNSRSYRMLSSAVTTTSSIHTNWQEGGVDTNTGFGTHITGDQNGNNGFDATLTGNPSMFTVDYSATPIAFAAITNTDQTNLEAGAPYLLFVRGDRSINLTDNNASSETTLRATGTLQYGSLDILEFDTVIAGDFAMFGNPYQSAVDINLLFDNGSDNVNLVHYHVYDPTQATYGAYVTVNLLDATNTGTSDANQYLQPGQAAQFETLIDGRAMLLFTEDFKAPGQFTITNATGNRLSSDNMLTVQLFTAENFNNGGPTHDSFGIIFGEGLDNEITSADAKKPMNFYENLGRDHNGTYLSIERRAMPQAEEVYALYSSGYNYEDYTLKMMVDGLDETFLYLDDNFTGTSTLLEVGDTVYNFSVNDALSKATNRFSIRTEGRLGVENNNMLAGVRLFPNPLNDNTFYVHAPKLNGEQVEVNITDMAGRQVYNNTLDCQDNRIAVSVNGSLTSGLYLVTVKFAGEENTYRLIKQ